MFSGSRDPALSALGLPLVPEAPMIPYVYCVVRRILLVDGNERDIAHMVRFFRGKGPRCLLSFARNGSEALSQLLDSGFHPRPDYILLDPHPAEPGSPDLLAEMKRHRELRRIPIVVLTTSASRDEVCAAYDQGAVTYFLKPSTYDTFALLLETVVTYWEVAQVAPH